MFPKVLGLSSLDPKKIPASFAQLSRLISLQEKNKNHRRARVDTQVEKGMFGAIILRDEKATTRATLIGETQKE